MSIAWLTLLQNVPWSEVISNAPKVAAGAKKLWQASVKKSPASGTAAPTALEARVIKLETAVAELHAQMLASSELIKALAEQNAQLVQRVETHRRRLRWLTWAAVIIAAAAAAALFGRAV
jgi:hypothetical protein